MVLARRSSPLADLFRSESERMRVDRARVDEDSVEAGRIPLADGGTPPAPPAGVD